MSYIQIYTYTYTYRKMYGYTNEGWPQITYTSCSSLQGTSFPLTQTRVLGSIDFVNILNRHSIPFHTNSHRYCQINKTAYTYAYDECMKKIIYIYIYI